MQHLGILREITGRHRSRLLVYDAYLAILSEGTEPIRELAWSIAIQAEPFTAGAPLGLAEATISVPRFAIS